MIQETISLLKQIESEHGPAAFACSFGLEDMVLLDLISKHARRIEVFTLDTGRLPEETHDLLDRVRDTYHRPDSRLFPGRETGRRLGRTERAQRRSIAASRSESSAAISAKCCRWDGRWRAKAPGLPACGASSPRRGRRLQIQEWDEGNKLEKFNPLLEWSLDDVWAYIRENNVPYNALHDRGYPSIGCAPCTRAVEPGQDIRAGRWWWEEASAKECGLHRSTRKRQSMSENWSHLQALEAESIYILREVVAQFRNPVLLYSIGKDSSVLVHLARKAFYPGPIPFPLLHVDTGYKFKEMIQVPR